MSKVTGWFANVSAGDPAVWVALGAGFAVVLAFLLLGRRQRRAAAIVVSAPADADVNPADVWLPPSKRADERRRSTRRSGVPTPVRITDPQRPKKAFEAFVLDRSTGGLRVASEKPFPSGSNLLIRPSNAPEEVASVTIIVRNCKEVGDYYELGCQFQEELPWHVLLMFG